MTDEELKKRNRESKTNAFRLSKIESGFKANVARI